jgi:hypothetical protein
LSARPNDVEYATRTALGDVDLHVDFARFDALEGDRVDMRQRHPPLPERIEYGGGRESIPSA